VRHVARNVVLVIIAAYVQPVVCVRGHAQIFCAAFGNGLARQIAPGLVPAFWAVTRRLSAS
jgi:hypothetical protein